MEVIRGLLPYGQRTLLFAALMGAVYVCPYDVVNTAFIYGPTLWLMYTAHPFFQVGYVLAMAHGIGHNLLPFIDHNGINVEHSAFPDVAIHFLMLCYSFIMFEHYVHTQGYNKLIRRVQTTMLVGSSLNVVASIVWGVSDLPFVYTSMFQALSTGSWVFIWLFFTTKQDPYFLPIGAAALSFAALNWFLFRHSHDIMAIAFISRYFETLFIFPTWIFAMNNKIDQY